MRKRGKVSSRNSGADDPIPFRVLRLSEIRKTIKRRRGGVPGTRLYAAYMIAVAAHLKPPAHGDLHFALENWFRRYFRFVSVAATRTALANGQPAIPTPQQLGDLLELTAEERNLDAIRTIRPCGLTPEEFEAARRLRKALKEQQRRCANGARPHTESITRTKPWEADGVSRRTWYRKGRHLSLRRRHGTQP
jgi:hypothetical protein